MLSDIELGELAVAGESDRVERKESPKNKNELRDAICAFANDLAGNGKPGVVYVGMRDDGSCAGLSVSDEILRELGDLSRDGNILPVPSITVQKRTVLGCEMAVVVVEPSVTPPVRVRGRTMVRIGPRRGVATLEEEQRLVERARSRILPFDLFEMTGATHDDLDLDFLRRTYLPCAVSPEILAENSRPLPTQLAALKVLTPGGVPTVLGILLAGREPTRFFPGAYIQFVRFDSPDIDVVIRDQKMAIGTVVQQIRDIEHVLELNTSAALDLSGGTERRLPDYPMPALREYLRNAVIHRSYERTNAPVHVRWFSDRIEILSPGGPYGKVTKDNFGSPGLTDQRNPDLAEAMRHLGLAQRFGVGLEIARQYLAKNGNPDPEFRVTETHVLVVVRRRQ